MYRQKHLIVVILQSARSEVSGQYAKLREMLVYLAWVIIWDLTFFFWQGRVGVSRVKYQGQRELRYALFKENWRATVCMGQQNS